MTEPLHIPDDDDPDVAGVCDDLTRTARSLNVPENIIAHIAGARADLADARVRASLIREVVAMLTPLLRDAEERIKEAEQRHAVAQDARSSEVPDA